MEEHGKRDIAFTDGFQLEEKKNHFIKTGESFKDLCVCLKNALIGQNSEHFLIFLILLLFISRAFVLSWFC